MYLYLKLFITMIILTIVRNSTADIPNCNYIDTVDISDSKKANDTYLFNGIEISGNITREYSYRELTDGSLEPVKPHLRACICKLKTCVRICCPQKNMLDQGKCDGTNEKISLAMINLTLNEVIKIKPTEMELRLATQSNFTDFLGLRDKFRRFDEVLSVKEDEYSILKDGSIVLYNHNEVWTKEVYCLYSKLNSDLWIAKHKYKTAQPPATIEIQAISLIFCFVTLLVYLFVKKLRNVLGKCLISTLFSLLIYWLLFILEELNLLNQICQLAAYSRYFCMISCNLWYSVISFHLWKLLTSMNREEPRYQFVTYSAFGWCTASISTGVIYILNRYWEDLHKWNWMPLVGYSGCSVKGWGPYVWIYFQGPILMLNIFNVIVFILTVIHIWKVKSELRKFKQDEERTIQCFDFDTETISEPVYYFLHYADRCFGILVFVLLILKRSTLKLIMEGIRKNR
nr:probable G-protein coupled receptor Mth-like 12 [Drosophila takahashii]